MILPVFDLLISALLEGRIFWKGEAAPKGLVKANWMPSARKSRACWPTAQPKNSSRSATTRPKPIFTTGLKSTA